MEFRLDLKMLSFVSSLTGSEVIIKVYWEKLISMLDEDFIFKFTANFTKVMAVGGLGAQNKVEVIDLSGNGKPCRSFPYFPIQDGSVGTFINDKVLVCGGAFSGSRSWGYYSSCYSYSMQVCFESKLTKV